MTNHSDDEDATPLLVASQEGHTEVVTTLLAANADVNQAEDAARAPRAVLRPWISTDAHPAHRPSSHARAARTPPLAVSRLPAPTPGAASFGMPCCPSVDGHGVAGVRARGCPRPHWALKRAPASPVDLHRLEWPQGPTQ